MYGLSTKKVAVVERFKQELMYGLSTKKVTIVERFNRAVIKGRGPGISPGFYERGPRLL